MKDLKAEFGKLGYENAATLLNSGNIVLKVRKVMKNWWAKTANSQIKDSITIRTAGTVRKLLEMCRK